MLADQLPRLRRCGQALAIGSIVAALAVPAASSRAAASADPGRGHRGHDRPARDRPAREQPAREQAGREQAGRDASGRDDSGHRDPGHEDPGRKQVWYRGYTFEVPRAWPVISLTRRPHTCVRFNEHVVYLGAAGGNQHCPSSLIGTTQAFQVAPAGRRTRRSSVEDPVARQITVTVPRMRLTATFDTDPAQIYRILASARLPAPVIRVPRPKRLPPAALPASGQGSAAGGPANPLALKSPRMASFPRVSPPALPANVANFKGRGFDTCTAPSRSVMRAWRKHSRYRAIGIYIGGSDRGCGQRNLSPLWVRRQAAAGWHFIPLYVGPQAAFGELHAPHHQGKRAADDAVDDARKLGFGPRTPLYYDMEAYRHRKAKRVLRFLSAWTRRLHALGYKSGVYSSADSGIKDLSRHFSSRRYKRPDVVYVALWNGSMSTRAMAIPRGEWTGHRRLHQYAGNVTQRHGGRTLNIDKDFLNVRLPTPGGTRQASRAAAVTGGGLDAFYRGTDGHLWYQGNVSAAGGPAPVDLGGTLAAQPTVVSGVPGTLDVFYEGTDHLLWEVTRNVAGSWSAPSQISRMGEIGSPPVAVAQPNGVVDVFWRGSADDHLWHGQFSPGKGRQGWKGPQDLRGSLASDPSPAESSPGTVQVFWRGSDGALWHVIRRPGRSWTRPRSLGMGPLGGTPHATARGDGAIGVFWRGLGNDRLWSASLAPGHRWAGPRELSGLLASAPFPLMSSRGRVHVFWKGTDGRLWEASRQPGTGWLRPFSLNMGPVRAGPFGAVGDGGESQVFWRGRRGQLWFAAQASAQLWSGPLDLGGHVG
ncbi:MAG: glycoside hydrolase domain-containing protein [Streptosporangiaceae bacterium]